LDEIKHDLAEEQKAIDYSIFFLSLIKQQCLQNISDLEAMKSKLEKSDSFRPVPDADGSFEIHYRNVSFGVTPEADRCTVDVMLKNEYHDVLFQKHHIDDLLTTLSAQPVATFVEDTDTG
jgi:hypothetical protein